MSVIKQKQKKRHGKPYNKDKSVWQYIKRALPRQNEEYRDAFRSDRHKNNYWHIVLCEKLGPIKICNIQNRTVLNQILIKNNIVLKLLLNFQSNMTLRLNNFPSPRPPNAKPNHTLQCGLQ